MRQFSESEMKFILDNELCRIATTTNNIPHVIPVCYIYKNNKIFFATDYKTKKYNNLKKNKAVSLVIDQYDKSDGNKGIHIEGIAEIIERGSEFQNLFKIFYDKFDWVKNDPWSEGEAPFIQIQIIKKISWGL
ncbi:MAG TPA: pyridoxamine 5'-phosphate oxidase family protein [Nitrososphaeraceae archaeon]|nr:pyridoxamine 5'-phosphate oxidase family protein [Nitrososphaeraceae archaeon]